METGLVAEIWHLNGIVVAMVSVGYILLERQQTENEDDDDHEHDREIPLLNRPRPSCFVLDFFSASRPRTTGRRRPRARNSVDDRINPDYAKSRTF